MKLEVFSSSALASDWLCWDFFRGLQKSQNQSQRPYRVAWPTGNSPSEFYQRLPDLFRNADLRNVKKSSSLTVFGLDEFVDKHPLRFLRAQLEGSILNHLAIPFEVHFPGDRDFEHKLAMAPLDHLILGVGMNGHIAFNEPGSSFESVTRQVELTESSRFAWKEAFGGIDRVPVEAATMGLAEIRKAKKITLLVFGVKKNMVLSRLLRLQSFQADFPVSALWDHPELTVLVDREAWCRA